MGLSASVMCTCYAKGNTTPPPFPEHIHIDASDSPRLNGSLKHDIDADAQFREWLRTCCNHPNLTHTATFVSSWKGYRAFMDALHQMGDEYFPTLIAELPDHNGVGYTTADKAESALAELAFFNQHSHVRQKAVLVDMERGNDVSLGSDIMNGTLAMDRLTGLDIGFDESGFFIRDRWELNRVLFRAMQVRQIVLHPEEHLVCYVDLEGGRNFECHAPLGKVIAGEDGIPRAYLQHFQVDVRPIPPRHYRYITEPLTQVFQASLETGNPVRWR